MIIGMDFSSLEETEAKGGRFFCDGREVEPVSCLAEHGVNAVRLRLWHDPYGPDGRAYEGGTCDLPCLIRTAKRAKAAGMEILLDLHYSDFWCDPARQLIPKAWQGQSLEELCKSVYDYTRSVIAEMTREGAAPSMVQVGNEITNGMLWPHGKLDGEGVRSGYDGLAALLKAGVAGVRDECDAKVMLHLERGGNKPLWQEWFDNIVSRGVEFDVIGASYYPYWHGGMDGLRDNLNSCIHRYDKDVIVVETSYPFTSEHYSPEGGHLCIADPKCADGSIAPYPLSPEGQVQFTKDLIELVKGLDDGRGKGIYWWEPAWLPADGTCWASESALEYCNETCESLGNEWSNQCLFDYEGKALPALELFKNP